VAGKTLRSKDQKPEASINRSPAADKATAKPGKPTSVVSNRDRAVILAHLDRLLVERCVAGEVAAWEELYAQCHDSLLISIQRMLGRARADQNVVDEIAARVWYAVVANDGELLLRYNPNRGARLITFLRTLAKFEARRRLREERRHRERDLLAANEKKRQQLGSLVELTSSLSEFLATLTPQERAFCDAYLLSLPPSGMAKAEPKLSSTNIWQLTRRIRKKLRDFFRDEP